MAEPQGLAVMRGVVYTPAVYMDNGSNWHFLVHCSPEMGFNPDLVGAAYTRPSLQRVYLYTGAAYAVRHPQKPSKKP